MHNSQDAQTIQHLPSFVSIGADLDCKFEPLDALRTQSLDTVKDTRDECFYQFVSKAGLSRALILLMAGNLPFYQSRLEALLRYHDVDLTNLGGFKEHATRLKELITAKINPEHQPPLAWEIVKEPNYNVHGMSVAVNPHGSILWARNSGLVLPDENPSSIGNHLAGAIAISEFATKISAFLEKTGYVFHPNMYGGYTGSDEIAFLEEIFAADNGNSEFFSTGKPIRPMEQMIHELDNITFLDKSGEERKLIEYRHHTHPIIRLKPNFEKDFRDIIACKDGIVSGTDKLIFVLEEKEGLKKLQDMINANIDERGGFEISIEELKDLFGDDFKANQELLHRHKIKTVDKKRYIFTNKVFFLMNGGGGFLPRDNEGIPRTLSNIQSVLEISNPDGLIDGKQLHTKIEEFLGTGREPRKAEFIYEPFKKYYFDVVIPEGTLFRLDDDQRQRLAKLLESWQQAIERYKYLSSPEGKNELETFYKNDPHNGEYLPSFDRLNLTKGLLRLMVTKMAITPH